jgi:PAS domain S-box-containing protein
MDLHPGTKTYRVAEVKFADLDPIRRALNENTDWSQDLVEHSQDLRCIHDLQGRLLAVNPAPARVLGYSVEELLKIPMRELIVPEFRPDFDAYLKDIAITGESHGWMGVVTRSGEQRIWEYHNTLRTEGVASPIVRGRARDVTEQRRAERSAREANELLRNQARENERTIRELKLFRALVDRSNDAIEVVDPETLRFLDVNEKACSALGYSREELLSLAAFDINPAITESSAETIKEELLKSGSLIMESVHRRKDGSTFPVELSVTRFQFERDYIVAIARDLTERKRTEETLREYERVVQGLEEVIAVVDRDYRYVIANRAFLNLRGMEKEQVVGRLISEVVGEKDFETIFKPKLDECFQGKVVRYQWTHEYPNVGKREIFASYFPIEGPNGIDRIAAVAQDITERKQAEEALRTSERRQHKIAQQLEAERARLIEAQAVATVGSWEVELPGLEITWSEQTHRIFETDPSHFRPRRPNFVEFIHPEDRARVDAAFQASLENGAPSTVKYRIVMADGRLKVLEEHWRVFHDEQGRPIRLVGTCRDVTDQRRSEEALRRSEENYRNFVSQSSEGIYQDNLDPAIPVDLPEDEFIHRFLRSTVMVECNNAMAAMYGFASWEELRGRPMSERVLPEDPRNIEMAREFMRSGFRFVEHESREVDRYGNPKIFTNSMVGTVEDGRLVHIRGIQRDITEKVKLEESRQKAEEALRRNLARLQEVTEELRLAKEKLFEEKLYLEESIDTELGFGEIVGRSSALKEVMQKVAKVAPSDATVLLLGETGTGKELVARAIHRMSRREGNSFIKLNCAAIPSGLLESELFGHEKGAFTGAVARKLGRLELADRGTLFLDEVGEIPLSLQPKLLRVLQDLEFERLGGTQTLKVNFRLLAATNRDLLQSVKGREFRSDLYYRLNVFPILIPPLRERREDIRLLIEHFVRKFAAQMKKSISSIPSKTMEMMVRWDWPGNIRELENFVERSVILTPGSVLQAPLAELQTVVEQDSAGASANLRDKERERILRALRDCHGQLGGADGAAVRLGMKRTTLQSKLDQLGIKPGSYR